MAERTCVLVTVILLACVAMFRTSKVEAESQSMPVDGLIEVMNRASETLEIQHDHETDFAMIDPQPSPSDKHEKAKREIIIFTRPNCPPCDQWKQIEQPKFESDGWVVAISNDPGSGPWPHFIIDRNGKQYSYKGYLLFSRIDEATR